MTARSGHVSQRVAAQPPVPQGEFRCISCGYGIVARGLLPECPMCHESLWETVAWRPFSVLLHQALGADGHSAAAARE